MQGVAAFGAESGDGVREEVHCSFWTLNLVARWGCGGKVAMVGVASL